MGKCISPFTVESKKGFIPVPCGVCLECKKRKISGWSYRLVKEAEVSTSAFFITLTYDNDSVPITKNKFMTLKKRDLQLYFKRLRKENIKRGNKIKIKYYAAGEYGGDTMRPHYHIILFNALEETIDYCWSLDGILLGHVHFGDVNEASVGYTLKYISKKTMIPVHSRDDRQKEFSLMSKGMGAQYINPKMIKWHKADLKNRMYIPLMDGKKIAMPRYYKEKIYTQLERNKIAKYMEMKELREWQNMDLSTREKKDKEELLIRMNKARQFNKETRLNTKL